jgi:hypothetical protein
MKLVRYLLLPISLVLISGCSGSTADAQWLGMENQMYGHLQSYVDNARVGNQQGALDSLTKIAADCRDAGILSQGSSSDPEKWVRNTCLSYHFPLP